MGFRSALTVLGRAPDEDDEQLQAYGRNHLNRERISSPFVSFTNSFIWALQKAILMQGRLSVFEPRSLNKIYHAQPVCRKIIGAREANFKGYSGSFEYWAWQQVR